MAYQVKIRISYTDRVTSLERLRAVDERYKELVLQLAAAERLWRDDENKGSDELRTACTLVLGHVVGFVKDVGVSGHPIERLNDLLVALGELLHGRNSTLLSPARVHPSSFAAIDLAHQGLAQVSVDLLREAGMSAGDARKKVASIFAKHGIPKFGEAKLRSLQSRLIGPGCSQDEAHESYVWAKSLLASHFRSRNPTKRLTLGGAIKLGNDLVSKAKRSDHRHRFLFAA